MSKPQRGLGKGLSALLGEVQNVDQLRKPVGYVNKEVVTREFRAASSDVLRIPVEMIEPNPYQPRLSFDKESLDELASSIRTLGLIQPITVRRMSDTRYQIISGERRYRACSLIGMKMIPAYVRDADDQGMLELSIVENIQRENLDPIEEALSYQRLIDECNLTQEQMADRVGKKRATVTNILRLLNLPAKPQHDLKVGLLSVGHAKVILGIDDPAIQEKLSDKVVAEGWSVRKLEEVVRKILMEGLAVPVRKRETTDIPDCYSDIRSHFSRLLPEDRMEMKFNANGRGSITFKFSSEEEARNFLEGLKNS